MSAIFHHSFGVLFLIIVTTVNSGCAYSINASAKRAAEAQVKRFSLHVNRVDPFVECLETPGGICRVDDSAEKGSFSFFSAPPSTFEQQALTTNTPPPSLTAMVGADKRTSAKIYATRVAADLARDVLNHPIQSQLNGIFNIAKGVTSPTVKTDLGDGKTLTVFEARHESAGRKTVAKVNISLGKFQEYQEKVEAATLLGGWDALVDELTLLDQPNNRVNVRQRAYISHYFRAYFRDGRFYQAKISGSKLKDKIVDKLKNNVPGLTYDEYSKLASKLFPQYNFNAGSIEYIFGKIEDMGFVTRGGQKFAFPGLEASATLGSSKVSLPQVDYIAVGSDLIRVLLHAIYDADLRIPAVSNATGVTVPIDPLIENQPGSGAGRGSNVDSDEFERIETRASLFEGVTSAGVGRLVRGISFLSLNNEALATAIETAVGLAVRKQIEKVMWCWYECRFNEFDDVGDYIATSHGDVIDLEIVVSGFPEHQINGTANPK